jgi:hypothetical protein
VLGEADALIRRLLEDRGVEVPHLIIAVTWNGRSSCAATSVRMPCVLGEDLINFACAFA